eukprot:2178506-Amphidinium_carterae.1
MEVVKRSSPIYASYNLHFAPLVALSGLVRQSSLSMVLEWLESCTTVLIMFVSLVVFFLDLPWLAYLRTLFSVLRRARQCKHPCPQEQTSGFFSPSSTEACDGVKQSSLAWLPCRGNGSHYD